MPIFHSMCNKSFAVCTVIRLRQSNLIIFHIVDLSDCNTTLKLLRLKQFDARDQIFEIFLRLTVELMCVNLFWNKHLHYCWKVHKIILYTNKYFNNFKTHFTTYKYLQTVSRTGKHENVGIRIVNTLQSKSKHISSQHCSHSDVPQ